MNDNGTVLETFDYYPFGLLMPKRTGGEVLTMEKYTGKERDSELNLDYFGARYYDAALGRWFTVDPLADEYPEWSPYNYVMNNPLLFSDPTGLCPEVSDNEACVDDTSYKEGAIVENQFGSWQYLGEGQWQTLSLAEGTGSSPGALETVVKDAPQILDAVQDAAFQMTVFLGSGLLVTSQTPFPHDDLGLAGLTSLSAGVALGADLAATGFSAIDAFVFGGDENEFRIRFIMISFSIGYSMTAGGLYKSQLRKTLLDPNTQRALGHTGSTTTSKIATRPQKRN